MHVCIFFFKTKEGIWWLEGSGDEIPPPNFPPRGSLCREGMAMKVGVRVTGSERGNVL